MQNYVYCTALQVPSLPANLKKCLHVQQVKRPLWILASLASLQFQCHWQRAKQARAFDIICVALLETKSVSFSSNNLDNAHLSLTIRLRSAKIYMPVTFFTYQINNCRSNLRLWFHFIKWCPHYLLLHFAPQIDLNDVLLCFKTFNLIRLLLFSVFKVRKCHGH
jgi:hypothetical protein